GGDLVAERAADLRDAEGQLQARGLEHVPEVDEGALRGLGSEVGDVRGVLDRADVGLEHQVELAGLGCLPAAPRAGGAPRRVRPVRSTSGSVKPETWPDASHTRGCMMIAASSPTTSSRRVTTARHQASFTLRLSSTPSGP